MTVGRLVWPGAKPETCTHIYEEIKESNTDCVSICQLLITQKGVTLFETKLPDKMIHFEHTMVTPSDKALSTKQPFFGKYLHYLSF